MMREEEEEETLFDQQGLLGTGKKSSWDWEWFRRITKTIALSLAFFAMGLCVSMPGATLPDLEDRTHTSTEKISLIFSARSIGYLLGSVVGGVLFDYFDQQILLFYTLIFTGIATIAVPWCTALAALAGMIAVQGVALGVLDTGGNMFCIKIWSKSSPPYMQLLHFCFAVGAFLAPLLARPFLGDGVLATNNTAYSISIPVNTHVPHFPGGSTGTDSGAGRVTRDVDLRWLTDSELQRYVRDTVNSTAEVASPGDGVDVANLTESLNETGAVTNFTDSFNETFISTTPKPTTTRPPKPIANGDHLNPKHASGDTITEKLKEHKDDQRADTIPKEKEEAAKVITTTAASLCTVYENITVTNSTDNSTVMETVEKQVTCSTVAPVGATVGQDTSLNNATESHSSPSVNGSVTAVPLGVNGTQFVPASPVAPTTQVVTTTTTTVTTTTATPKPTTAKPEPTTTQPSATAKAAVPPESGNRDSQGAGTQDDKNSDENASENDNEDNTFGQESALERNTTSSPSTTTTTTTTTTRRPKPQSTLDSLVSGALDAVRNMSRIQFAYMIVGLFLLGDAIFFMVLYCRDCRAGTLLHQVLALGPSMAPAAPCFRVSILTLLFSFFLIYVGMEVTFGGLVTTFAVDSELHWSRAQGATLAALFWGSIATGRGMSIFIARCFKPPCMLVTDLVLVMAGGSVLSLGLRASPAVLWVGTVVLGLGMSSVFPTAVSWADCYYPLTGRATAVFIAGSGVGEMVIPVLTGYLFEKVSSMWLMYVVLALGGLLTLVYTCLQCIASRNPAPVSVSKLGFMPLQNEDEGNDNNSIALRSMDSEDVVNGSAGYTETVMHRRKPAISNDTAIDVEETTKLVDLSD